MKDDKESKMKGYMRMLLLGTLSVVTFSGQTAPSQQKAVTEGTVQVHMVITDAALRIDKEPPPLKREDVKVKQGKTFLKVTQLIPAQRENAAFQLMIMIDDTLDTAASGHNLNDLKAFISAQPPSTVIGVAYMSNATANVAQNFTADHALAVKAVRLPRGTTSSMDSPYLSLIIYHSMPTISVDATSASEISQRYNVIVHSIYAVGIGRSARSSFDLQLGLSGLAKIADETGGECFSLSTSNPVSFKPYLETLQKLISNQYFLAFQAVPRKKAGFQRVNVQTELPNSKILALDNVWVPAATE